MFETPILFLVFNRPDVTAKVFEQIRFIQPKQLFIAADGPRQNFADDDMLCGQTRNLILDNITWPCEVKTLMRETNLGCKIAVSSAITWFFTQVEEGIILEDDTLPNQSFFKFCQRLLIKYRTDDSIFHISGNNFQLSMIGDGSYYLSKLPHIWGWASWRRAWKNYDVDLKTFDQNDEVDYFQNEEINLFWKQTFTTVKANLLDTWDYQWVYTVFTKKGFVLQPQFNMVKNIGFDERSKRTSSPNNFLANLKTYEADNLIHPTSLVYDENIDVNFLKYFNWLVPVYENRMSGSQALKTAAKIARKRIFKQ
jgi:hypothetical protein